MRTGARYQAISITLLVGIAFFLQSCVSVKSLQKPARVRAKKVVSAPTKPPVREGDFALAESALQAGHEHEAMELYAAYLKKYPEGEHAALSLRRMGDIYFNAGNYEDALGYYEKFTSHFPKNHALPEITYQIANIEYRLGEYRASRDRSLEWIGTYPAHPLKRNVAHVLGLDYVGLGNSDQALYWLFQAEKESSNDPRLQSEIQKKLDELINTGDITTLEHFLEYAAGSDFIPPVYYRLATLYLEKDDLQNARKAAMALVRSTAEQRWVTLGREVLERIQAELSVRRNTFGCLLPLSGPFALYGEQVLNGIELGLGVFGTPNEKDSGMQLLIRDTEGKPQRAAAALKTLANQDRVIGVIGPLTSKASLAAAQSAEKLGVPLMSLTQRESITEEGNMVFRNFLVPSKEIEKLISTAVTDLGLKRFAILYPDNSYGRFFMNKFWDGLEEAGASVTAVESYKPEQTDFGEQIKKMTGLYYPRPASLVKKLREMKTPYELETEIEPEKPEPIIDFDAVFIPDTYQRIIMIAPQLMYHDVTGVRLIGTSLWQSPKLVEMAGKYVQDAIFTSGFFKNVQDPVVRSFVRRYKEEFETDPGILAATGYDTAMFFKTLIKDFNIRTRKELRKAILTSRDFHGVTGNIAFDANGEVTKEPLVLTVSGRRMTVFK